MNTFVADFHIHSYYSRATSKDLDLEHLALWAQLKGVQLVATGDIAHPGWLSEIREKLTPVDEGVFQLKAEYTRAIAAEVPPACQAPVYFMLGGEVSNIYKRHDAVRKIHNLIFMPSFSAVERLQSALERIGNIRSDGRPILGLDSRDLLEIVLATDPAGYLIPAHIWTPWFAMLGSKSGFDTVEACFGDLTEHIFALETGLSADPAMCWRVSNLDGYTLVSNSDAHSPQKLAREASLFATEISYPALFAALQSGDPDAYRGTLEFFPEEGKYHFDGHRKCGVCWHPQVSIAHNDRCTVCGKPVTVGVMHRVEVLADRPVGGKPARTHPYRSIIPLPEILGHIYSVGATSKRVQGHYQTLLSTLGNELHILLDAPLADVERQGGPLLAEGIRRMRSGEVMIEGGYDGEYGVIKIFERAEVTALGAPQLDLFTEPERPAPLNSNQLENAQEPQRSSKKGPDFGLEDNRDLEESTEESTDEWTDTATAPAHSTVARLAESGAFYQTPALTEGATAAPSLGVTAATLSNGETAYLDTLNPEQRAAVLCVDDPVIIVAGPGTGKTRTLTVRIAYLICTHKAPPEQILAITFTNKAAEEMAQRLRGLLGAPLARRITIKTFHAFGAMLLRDMGEAIGIHPNFAICSEEDQKMLLKQVDATLSEKEVNQLLVQISDAKNQLLMPDAPALADRYPDAPQLSERYGRYAAALRANRLLDFDDLLLQTVRLLESRADLCEQVQARFRWISVDEYQDINYAQYRLLRLLTPPASNLCAIGDPDQAIYGFRGAQREYFMQFQQDFPTAQIRRLHQNYRSTQTILDAAMQVIEQGADRAAALEIWSDFVDQTKLTTYQAPTDKAEAEYVVHQIEQMVGGTSYFSLDSGRTTGTETEMRGFSDFAVLYRTSAQSRLLVEALERSGIPYQTVGQTPLVEYKEIRQILAYLWLIINPTATFYQEQIYANARRKDMARIGAFVQRLQQQWTPQDVSQIIDAVYHFLQKDLEQSYNERQQERVEQFTRRATPFGQDLPAFLEAMLLQQEADLYNAQADRVTLMTLHAAKGLEFPVVFMVGCEETLLPYALNERTTNVEEERRLFYVGMTRAQQRLFLLHARRRLLFGARVQNAPSRFLNDIESTLKELQQMAARKPQPTKPEAEQLSLF
ncbi:MAG: UvrD-helicase domain-containing protein [Caldilineaceae bacterium]